MILRALEFFGDGSRATWFIYVYLTNAYEVNPSEMKWYMKYPKKLENKMVYNYNRT